MQVDGELALWAHNAGLPLDTAPEIWRARALMRLGQRDAARGCDDWPDTRPFEAFVASDARAAHHQNAARLTALDHRDVLGQQHALAATLTGSASCAHVTPPPGVLRPLLTSGCAVRGPSLLGTS